MFAPSDFIFLRMEKIMKKKKLITIVLSLLMALTVCVPVLAEVEADMDSAGTLFVSGDIVSVPSTKFFAGFAAGRSVSMTDAEAQGSVMIAGQEVNIGTSLVAESLYAAGNTVSVRDTVVGGNIYAAGNNVVIGENVSGNGVYAAGSSVVFSGETRGAYLAAESVTLDGVIDGDVRISADNVTVTKNAVVKGELNIASSNEPDISDAADINDYKYDQITEGDEDAAEAASKGGIIAMFLGMLGKCMYWIVAMAVFGLLLCCFFGDHLDRALTFMKERPGAMIGTGIISWLAIPVAAILLCCSYILAPIGGMLMLAYVLLLCAGLAFTGASVARLVFPKMNVFLSAIIGIAVLEVIRMIPFVGLLVGIAADMYLLAYVVQSLWMHRIKKNVVE